jgi:adhesin/invasin
MRTIFDTTMRAAILAGTVSLIAACDRSGDSDGPHPAVAIQVVSGDAQRAVVGEELSAAVVVRVVDASGGPVAGHMVSFRVTGGGGSVFAGVATSGADGRAADRWILGTSAGTQTLEARVVDATSGAAIAAALQATATPGPIASIAITTGDGQTAQQLSVLPTPIVARVADRYGNGVPNVPVAFSPATECGSASPAQIDTDETGKASATWTLGRRIGLQQLTTTIAGVDPVTAQATATASPVQAVLTLVAGGDQSAAVGTTLAQDVAVQLLDLHGSAIPGQPVSFHTDAAGASVAPTSTTDLDGSASVSWQLGTTASQQQLRADATDPVTGQPVTSVIVKANAVAGPPATVSVASGDGQTEMQHFPLPQALYARVLDAYGNGVPEVDVSFAPATDCGSVSPGSATSDASGKAGGTQWMLGTLLGDQTVSASAPGATPATFHATATQAAPFDGVYTLTVVGCCANPGGFEIRRSFVINEWVWSSTLGDDGALTFSATVGHVTSSYYEGTLVLDGAGGSTGSGSCVYNLSESACRTGTWTAVRQ